MNDRPAIPEAIKRRVRQRCGFGCVICGLIIYEYHHILPYSKVEEHTANNLVLLCDRHHKEVTNKLLPSERLTQAIAAPYNIENGSNSSPYSLHYGTPPFEFILGNNVLKNETQTPEFQALRIDDLVILGFRREDNNLLINLTLYDKDNKEILKIIDNELQYAMHHWDITFIGQRLIIHCYEKPSRIQIFFEPPHKITIERADIFYNGIGIAVRKGGLFFLNSKSSLVNCASENFFVGLSIRKEPLPSAFNFLINDEQRYIYATNKEVNKFFQDIKKRFK